MATHIIVPVQGYFSPFARSKPFKVARAAETRGARGASAMVMNLASAVIELLVGTAVFLMFLAIDVALFYLQQRFSGQVGGSVVLKIPLGILAVGNLLLFLIFQYRIIRRVLAQA